MKSTSNEMSLTLEAWEYAAILSGKKTQHRIFTPWQFGLLSYEPIGDTLIMVYPRNGGTTFKKIFRNEDELCRYAVNFCPYRQGDKVELFVAEIAREPVGYFYANVTTRYTQEITVHDALAEGLRLDGKKQWVIPDYTSNDENSHDLVRFFTDHHTLALNIHWRDRCGEGRDFSPIRHELLFSKGSIQWS